MWYPAAPGAPLLGYPTKIQSLLNSRHPWLQQGVGEVYNAPRRYNRRKPIPFLNYTHVCGTREDFTVGGVRDAIPPPVVYDRNGIPICCQPPFVGQGGAVGSGTATVSVTHPTYLTTYYGEFVAFVGFMDEDIPNQRWVGRPATISAAWVLTSPLYLGQGYWEFKVTVSPFCTYRTSSAWPGLTTQVFTFFSGGSCALTWTALP